MEETTETTEPTDAAESPKLQAAAQVEQTGPCARLVKVEVAQEEVQKQIDESYEELRKSVFVKGFRIGHVPRHVLQSRFGDDVLNSVKESLVTDSFRDAIEDHGLTLALAPDLGEEKLTAIEIDPAKPLTFEVSIEVIPEFTIDNYKGIRVERPAIDLTDDDIAHALESFRMSRGQYKTLEEGQVADADIPVCHVAALADGQEVWSEQEIGVSIAAESLGGMAVPGLKDALLGAKVGDTRTVACQLPDNFPDEAHRGKQVSLEITIDQIRRFEAPPATDEWAKTLEFENLDDLREELQDDLHRERQTEADRAVEAQIDDRLLELTDFDVPDGLVERLAEDSKNRIRAQLLYNGVPEDQIDKLVEERATATRDTALRACKLNFIHRQIAEQEKIFVTEDELDARIQAIALNYRRRPEEVREDLEGRGQIDPLRRQMREERVRDYLVESAEVIEAGQEPAPDAEPAADAKPGPAPDAKPEPAPKPKAKPKAKPKSKAKRKPEPEAEE